MASQNGPMHDYYKEYMDKLRKKVEEASKTMLENAYKDTIAKTVTDLKEVYHDVASNFYASYTPEHYKRNESLYDLFVLEVSEDGRSANGGFHPERMTAFRSGYNGEDGLYDQVFRKGWHGGAGSIAAEKVVRYGSHPDPGTPYYRTPLPRKKRFGEEDTTDGYRGFFHWGKPASVADISPRDDFMRRKAEYESTVLVDTLKERLEYHKNNVRITM